MEELIWLYVTITVFLLILNFISSEIIIGKKGFDAIIEESRTKFGKKLITSILINEDLGEQFIFLRMFENTETEVIKVEFLQNMRCLFEPEIVKDIKLFIKMILVFSN